MSITEWSLSARMACAQGVDLTGLTSRHGRVPRGKPGPSAGRPPGTPTIVDEFPGTRALPGLRGAGVVGASGAAPDAEAVRTPVSPPAPDGEAPTEGPVCAASVCDQPASRAFAVRVDVVDASHWSCAADDRGFCDSHADQEVTRIFSSIRSAS